MHHRSGAEFSSIEAVDDYISQVERQIAEDTDAENLLQVWQGLLLKYTNTKASYGDELSNDNKVRLIQIANQLLPSLQTFVSKRLHTSREETMEQVSSHFNFFSSR